MKLATKLFKIFRKIFVNSMVVTIQLLKIFYNLF